MSDEAVKKRLQRARQAFRFILEQSKYRATIEHGVIIAKRQSETRHILVYLSKKDMPKLDQLPPGYEAVLKVGRNKFI